MEVLDLMAERCPNAQIKVTRLLSKFEESELNALTIKTIEPSLLRSVIARVEMLSLNIDVEEGPKEPITETHIREWDELFDEEDWSDVTIRYEIVLSKRI